MIVYVLTREWSYEPSDLDGVHATLEGAQAAAQAREDRDSADMRRQVTPLRWEAHGDEAWIAYGTAGGTHTISRWEVGP